MSGVDGVKKTIKKEDRQKRERRKCKWVLWFACKCKDIEWREGTFSELGMHQLMCGQQWYMLQCISQCVVRCFDRNRRKVLLLHEMVNAGGLLKRSPPPRTDNDDELHCPLEILQDVVMK